MPPLVNAQETTELLSLLASPDQTFKELTRRFKEAWPLSSCNRLRALFAILLFLQEGAIKHPVSRCAGLHLLHCLTKSQPPGKNPFSPFLVQATQDPAKPYAERLFIQQLLVEGKAPEGPIAEALQAIGQLLSTPILAADHFWGILAARTEENAAKAQQQASKQEKGPKAVGIPEGIPTEASADVGQNMVTEVEGVPPPYIRRAPPLLPVQPGEMRWLHPQLPQLIRWDYSMGQDAFPLAELQQLFRQALKGPLLPAEQQQVLKELEADRKLVLLLNLSPSSLPDLVEHNPAIAIEVFLRLIQFGHGQDFLPALVSMEMSLHSMEVVNRLSTAVDLPLEFVHSYISNCIQSCRAAQEDKYVQTRRVRLVCVFLQSLIKNRIINVQDLFYEMQSFCVEFSRVREAAALFRLLKTLENGVKTGSEMLPQDVASSSSAV